MSGALFVKLEVTWADHPKLIRAGMDGRGLHATALCLAKRLETDGWIDRILLHREGATDDLIDRLVDLRLLEVEGDQVRPWNWHSRNPSQGAIDARRASRSEAGRRGNHSRYDHPGPFEDCGICNPSQQTPRSSHVAIAPPRSAIAPDRTPSPETEREGEREGETTTPTSGYSYTDREPDQPVEPAVEEEHEDVDGEDQAESQGEAPLLADLDPDHIPDIEQAVRRTAVAIGRRLAADADNPDAYAASITRRILTGPDPTDRDLIELQLTTGQRPDAIATHWAEVAPPPADTTASSIGQHHAERPPPPPYEPTIVEGALPMPEQAARARAIRDQIRGRTDTEAAS